MTKDEIKKELDEYGIEYNSKATKDELKDLLDQELELQNQEKEPEKTYIVVHAFKDLEDGGRVYHKDDPYPKNPNLKLSEERIAQLTSKDNKIGKPLIKVIKEQA